MGYGGMRHAQEAAGPAAVLVRRHDGPGTPALIGWLGLASLALIAVVSTLVVAFSHEDTRKSGGWSGVVWMSLLRTLDPGTMGGDTGRPLFLVLMLTVTIGGIFIVSALIGVLTTGLENRIQMLRRAGRG